MQYRAVFSDSWRGWLTNTTDTQAQFTGDPGQAYYFRVRAFDDVGNAGAWTVSSLVSIKSVTKYYHHGGARVAMRKDGEVYYLHGDHLGSTSLTTDSDGNVVSEARYHPFGSPRWQDGVAVTDFTFTSQRDHSFGLLDYNARYYDSVIGRFISADAVVSSYKNPQNLNRYAYVRNNPLRYTDSTGHAVDCGGGFGGCVSPGAFIYRATAAYKANAPDATRIGVSVTTGLLQPLRKLPVIGKLAEKVLNKIPTFINPTGTRGIEWVKHRNGEADLFWFSGLGAKAGESRKLGGGFSVEVYKGGVRNLDSLDDLPGVYHSERVTAASNWLGLTGSRSRSADGSDIILSDIGWAGGKSLDASYHPVMYHSVSKDIESLQVSAGEIVNRAKPVTDPVLNRTLGRLIEALWFFKSNPLELDKR